MESSQVLHICMLIVIQLHIVIQTPTSIYLFIFALGKPAGAKGFSLSSYGSGASTVEPFLIDEKKITGKHVVFWVEKRLAAQGIIPVWKD